MASSFRLLERLPSHLFDNLVTVNVNFPLDNKDDDEITRDATVLQQRVCNKLKSSFPRKGRKPKAIVNVGDFLKIPETDLVRGLDPLLTFAECRELRRRICHWCAAKPTTVLQMSQNNRLHHNAPTHVPSGIETLDRCLKGGLRVGCITEIFGKAGTGKTQLAMQICAETAKRGHVAAYIETENKFSLKRLEQIVIGQLQGSGKDPMKILDKIMMYSAWDIEGLRAAISAVEVEACARCDPEGTESFVPFSVLVVDSIASPARRVFGKGQVASRAQSLMEFALVLKRMAETLKVAVVVVNQIGGSSYQSDNHHDTIDKKNDEVEVAGALGNSWHHCATTRLLVQRAESSAESAEQTRTVTITKSSVLQGGSSILLSLTEKGFESQAEPDASMMC